MKTSRGLAVTGKEGFTLLEVLLATIIFALAIFAIVQTRVNSLRNVIQSRRLFEAVQLAQMKMTEVELKYQKVVDTDGVKDSSFSTDSGTFSAPFENYSWTAELKASTLKIAPSDILKILTNLGLDKEAAEAQLEQDSLVLTNMNKGIKENFAELVVKISWNQFGRKTTLPFVTHLIPLKPKIAFTMDKDSTSSDSSSAPSDAAGASK